MHGAAVFSTVLLPSKKARINRLLTNAQSIEVCSEVCSEQSPFTQSCSEHRSVHGANVYSVILGASKVARSNRLLSRALSIEVCTEQPFTQTCSEHREYAWINRFSIMSGRTLVNFLSLFCFLFQL